MTADRDSSIEMYQEFHSQSVQRGKAIDILLPMIKDDMLVDLLAETYDLKQEVGKLKSQKKFLLWQKDNPSKGIVDWIQGME